MKKTTAQEDMSLGPLEMTLDRQADARRPRETWLHRMETSLGHWDARICHLKTTLVQDDKTLVQEQKTLAPMDMTLSLLNKPLFQMEETRYVF